MDPEVIYQKIVTNKNKTIVLFLVSIILTLLFVFSVPLTVTSFSMSPTFERDDLVLVEDFSLRFFPPKRGDEIVYKDPRQKDHPYVIKRIVGMPGEDLYIKNDLVYVIDQNKNGLFFPPDSLLGRRDNGKDWQIHLGPEDYLLMGDNRPGSKDGRETGTIQASEMFGRPYFRLYPLSRLGFL
jgi:signal peptidase I